MPIIQESGVEVLILSGTPEEMGKEYGRVKRDAVNTLFEYFFRKSEEMFDVPYDFLLRESAHCEPYIPDTHRREMLALADESGVSYEEIRALNALIDMDACYSQSLFQCCNVIAKDGAGFFVHGRNFDFPLPAQVHKSCALIICRVPLGDEACPTISVAWAGLVGTLTGCNRRGVSVGEVTAPVQGPTPRGIPLSLLIRDVLERAHGLDDAFGIVECAQRTHGFNLAIADGITGDGIGIECTPKLCEKRGMAGGFLVVDNLCLCRKTAQNRLAYPTGVLRHARAVQLMAGNTAPLTPELFISILRDNYDLSVAEYRNPGFRSCNTICNFMTAQSVVFLPREGRMIVSHNTFPAPLGEYSEVDVESLFRHPL